MKRRAAPKETSESKPAESVEESNSNEKKIEEVAIEGTQNIIDSIKDDCKIILPSTHVVYEGMQDVKKDGLLRDGAKFMGYPGRVLGKYCLKKKF